MSVRRAPAQVAEKSAKKSATCAFQSCTNPPAVAEVAPLDSWSQDLALAKRCVEGDRAAQRELYEKEKKRVHATLFRIFGSNRHVDDAIQDVFIQVFRSLENFRGEATLRTWIDRCTVRVAYAHIGKRRARGPELELVHDTAQAGDPDAERVALAREATRRLYAVLDRLEDKQRMAFTLHVIEGMPMADVASAMEATVVATKTRVFRARHFVESAARKDALLKSFVAVEGAGS